MSENKEIRKCLWKELLEKNLRGEGTSFGGRNRENLKCHECGGYDVERECYLDLDKMMGERK